MKKLTLALVAAMSLSTSVFAADTPVPGSTGQIKFIGQVTASGCTIVTGNTGTINLGSMPVNALKSQGFSGWTQGEIKFESCNLGADGNTLDKKEITAVNLTVLPGSIDRVDSNDYWYNDGTAADVAVEIKIAGDKGAQVIPATGVTEAIVATVDPVNDTALYTVLGRMVKTGDGVKSGSVEATMTFVASYK